MTEDERRAVESLRRILQEDHAVAETLLGFPWLADSVTEDESYAIYHLRVISREDPTFSKALSSFPWLTNDVTNDERDTVYYLREILQEAPAVAETLLGFPWLADSVNEEERRAVHALRDILRGDPAMAETVLESTWFPEGVTRTKRQTVQGLSGLYGLDRSSLSALTGKPWFEDGLSYEEFRLLGDLGRIAYRYETDAQAIIGMPFLETFELVDAMAVRSLRRLTCCGEIGPKRFRRLMAHPTISDGISDEEAIIVATLWDVRSFKTDIYDSLLDPDTVTLEERTIDLPHTGEMQLTIVRIRPGVERTMDLLERAVRIVEGFVEMPFPVNHVIFLAENTDHSGVSIDFSSMSGRNEKFDTDYYPEVDVLHVLVHEASHHYWNREWNLHWVEDGLGAFFQRHTAMQASVGPAETVVPIWSPKKAPCPITSNIAELERLHRDEGVGTDCSDSLGERLFQDLWRNLGDSVFRQGLANLYLTARSGDPDGGCEFAMAGVCRVEAAFKAAAPAEAASTVDKVIGRWYDNSEPYDLSHVDASPPNPKLPGGVEITRAYISLDRDRPEETRTDSFSASEVKEKVVLNLHFSLPTGRKTQELPLTFMTYFEDGFAYRVITKTYSFNAGQSQASRSLNVGDRPGRTWLAWGEMEIPPMWATGRYWVSVYHEGQKVAEVEFEVTP